MESIPKVLGSCYSIVEIVSPDFCMCAQHIRYCFCLVYAIMLPESVENNMNTEVVAAATCLDQVESTPQVLDNCFSIAENVSYDFYMCDSTYSILFLFCVCQQVFGCNHCEMGGKFKDISITKIMQPQSIEGRFKTVWPKSRQR